MSATFYRAFEDRYRGSREVIKERLAAYRPFLQALHAQRPQPQALDLGCGRGEWLELLGEQGFKAHGVDLDEGMLEACRERGLQAEHTDAIASLRAHRDDSLDLVSAFHLVEHIPFEVLQTLISEALRVLRPGGLLIMETPNPENLSVGAHSFYLDPSHEKPLPPQLLGFLADYAGFQRQRTVRLQEAPPLHTDGDIGLIEVLEGISPDYAIVAQKDAPDTLLASFDAVFEQPFGVTLGQAAQRYEQLQAERRTELHHAVAALAKEDTLLHQALAAHTATLGSHALQQKGMETALHALEHGVADLGVHVAQQRARLPGVDHELKQLEQRAEQAAIRLDAMHARLDGADAMTQEARAQAADANAHARAAEARAEAADAQAASANARADAAHAHAVAAEARAAAHAQHVLDLLSSSSWRITAPWRMVGHYVHRLSSAVRDGRLRSGLARRTKKRIKPMLLTLMRSVLRRPRMKRAARALLRHSPALQSRLQTMLAQTVVTEATLAPMPQPPAGDMSPRTLRRYHELTTLLHKRDHTDAHRN